jgi:hypothetical protein
LDASVREPKLESFLDWFRINFRIVGIAVAVSRVGSSQAGN